MSYELDAINPPAPPVVELHYEVRRVTHPKRGEGLAIRYCGDRITVVDKMICEWGYSCELGMENFGWTGGTWHSAKVTG